MKPVSLTLIAAALLAALPASAESVAPLTWTSCGAAGTSPADIAARTECARLSVPRDYANPAGEMLNLDVIRVIAAGERGERHDGSLLLEPDEFVEAIDRTVPAMASAWLRRNDGWRDVGRRLDLVGLAPRRMDDAGGADCLSATASLPRHASLGADTSFSNVVTAEHLALAVATACQNDPMHAHIGTQPRVEDMERLREALGQSRLHLLGVGRGGWVAARFAARYPKNVGRMLLDSTWDADGSVVEAMEARVAERGRTIRRAASEIVGAPDRYGWGSDARGIHRRLGALPPLAYATWVRRVVDASDLSAVLALGRFLERDRSMSTQALRDSLATTTLAADPGDERTVRGAAERMLDFLAANDASDPYGFTSRAGRMSPALVASTFAARCNDGYWGSSQAYWRARTRELHAAWPSAVGDETFQGMVCSVWPGAFGGTSAPRLDGSPSFLMVHAEFDEEAPLRNAALMLQGHGNAHMVVARDLRAHGVLARDDRPCVSAVASRFLADGILPATKLTNCRLPSPPPAP